MNYEGMQCPHCGSQTNIDPALVRDEDPMQYCPECDEPLFGKQEPVEKPDFEGHTPGPWVVFYPKVKGCGYGIDCADGSRSIVVFEDNAGVGSGDFSTDEEDLANAKLIAAAPDLLKKNQLLKERVKELEQKMMSVASQWKQVATVIHDLQARIKELENKKP